VRRILLRAFTVMTALGMISAATTTAHADLTVPDTCVMGAGAFFNATPAVPTVKVTGGTGNAAYFDDASVERASCTVPSLGAWERYYAWRVSNEGDATGPEFAAGQKTEYLMEYLADDQSLQYYTDGKYSSGKGYDLVVVLETGDILVLDAKQIFYGMNGGRPPYVVTGNKVYALRRASVDQWCSE
jgi:hypothetical protein